MKLKTFHAPTMAQALAAVRKDLGPDAMILHTRSFRVGAWLGFGGKNMVEITASGSEPDRRARSRPAPPSRVEHAPSEPDAPPRDRADDRAAVLGVSMPAHRASRADPRRPDPRDLAEIVVQRASAVVEPKPVLTRPSRLPSPPIFPTPPISSPPSPQEPARPPSQNPAPRPSIATRLPPRHDRPPNRIADATPPPPDRAEPALPARAEPPQAEPPRPVAPSSTQTATPTDDPAALRDQIANLQKMMGQVLESTRRTSVAVAKVDPKAAEAIEPGPLLTLINKLVDNDAPMEMADRVMSRVRDRLNPAELGDEVVVRQAVLREIEATIDTRADSIIAIAAGNSAGRPRIISLIGPTGVGKTTTVAKVAAVCKLRHGRRVGLITSDTYRIAAVEQLRTYAGIIGLPIKVVVSPDEMASAVADMGGMDVVIVDTAGRSQHDARRLDELKAFIDAARPDETHLVLSSTVGNTVMHRTAERFRPLGPDRCILTKLDEAVCTGHIAGLTGRIGLPLSFVTIGQEVPDDIEPARADRLARVALDGPGVLFKGSDRRE